MKQTAITAWLALAAISVPLYACVEQYRDIRIVAGAEDDCDYFHGAYALKDVEPGITDTNVRYVTCIYRN